jgi:peptidoglycan/xylan/chitin deacetylase (PgdA/CDA1 family)
MSIRLFGMAIVLLVACGRVDSDSQEQVFLGNLVGTTLADKTISLTYDDGPSEYTLPLARWLNTQGIQATFFVVGSAVLGKESILKELKDLGHLVANHSYTHRNLKTLTTSEVFDEIEKTNQIIKPYVAGPFLFRAPFGSWSPALGDFINSTSLSYYGGNIFWDIGGTLDGQYAADWNCWSAKLAVVECAKRYEAEVNFRRRGIVLMHDVTIQTWQMSRYLIPNLLDSGYKFVRADKIPRIIEATKPKAGASI